MCNIANAKSAPLAPIYEPPPNMAHRLAELALYDPLVRARNEKSEAWLGVVRLSHSAGNLDRARRRLQSLDRLATLRTDLDALSGAITLPTSEEQARMIFGSMLEGFPPAAQERAGLGYIDAMVFELAAEDDEGPDGARCFSPYVLAGAARLARRKLTFLPSIAEMLGFARTRRGAFLTAEAVTSRMVDLRIEASAIVVEFGTDEEREREEADDGDDIEF